MSEEALLLSFCDNACHMEETSHPLPVQSALVIAHRILLLHACESSFGYRSRDNQSQTSREPHEAHVGAVKKSHLRLWPGKGVRGLNLDCPHLPLQSLQGASPALGALAT